MTAQPFSVRRTSRRGLRYGYDGTGPAVVLVHGWCLNRQVWMYLEQALVTAGRTVITPDLAGYGESGGLRPRTSLADHADDLTDLLDELDVERAVLVGFAFGAAVIFSAENYQRVGALVSVAIPSAATAPYDRMPGAIMKDWPRFAARSAQAIVPEQASAETKDWLSRMFGGTSLAAALAGLDILRSFEPAGLVKRWEVPAFFVHGSDDPIAPAAISKECAERFGGQYVEISSPAHLVVIDQKEAVLQVVQDAVAAALRAAAEVAELVGLRRGTQAVQVEQGDAALGAAGQALVPQRGQGPGHDLTDRSDGAGDVLVAGGRDVTARRGRGHVEQVPRDAAADGREHVVRQALLDVEQGPGHLLGHGPGQLAVTLRAGPEGLRRHSHHPGRDHSLGGGRGDLGDHRGQPEDVAPACVPEGDLPPGPGRAVDPDQAVQDEDQVSGADLLGLRVQDRLGRRVDLVGAVEQQPPGVLGQAAEEAGLDRSCPFGRQVVHHAPL
jgi:pimeloyl-ACP methyl ester carboxylesterase